MNEPSLGQRIKDFRNEKSLSQAKVAEAADLSPAYISELENGVAKRPSGQVLLQLAQALGVTIADLLGTAPPPPQASIPDGLAEFATKQDLLQVDVEMLAGIRFRGERPRTARRWAMIYDAISASQSFDD